MNDSMNVAGNAINTPDARGIRTRSKFPTMSYHLFNTERFGEYMPSFVMECVEGDKVSIRSGGKTSSFSLKAPLMQSIFKKKDFYEVPMEAILPFNWDKFYTNPVIGDDVPDDCGTGVKNFWNLVGTAALRIRKAIYDCITDTTASPKTILTCIIRGICFLEYFYSNGSLIRSLGCSGSRYFHYEYDYAGSQVSRSFDKWFDEIVSLIRTVIPYFAFEDGDGNIKYCVLSEASYSYLSNGYSTCNIHDALQYFRDDLNCKVDTLPSSVDQTFLQNQFADFFDPSSTKYVISIDLLDVDYNLDRLWAYQLVCAHFYSNDHVDFIYSANLLRQLVNYCVRSFNGGEFNFSMNGLFYQYDYLSAKYFDKAITFIGTSDSNALDFLTSSVTSNVANRGYFGILLSYRRSLRFVDYFTGARTRPLAVGDVNVDVQTGSPNYVSVVDVSRNIQRQRFFNAVNRFGRKFEEYIKGLSGVSPAVDYHNPLYLAHSKDLVYGVHIENTGADQLTKGQTVTSRLESNGDRYQFEFDVDRPCIVIGISYYDINRLYLYNCERQLLHMNRFDMFNPYMQFIGDQDVKFAELGCKKSINYTGPFGYQIRHMEYKQRYDQGAGGFVENLPGFAFCDNADGSRANSGIQSVDFIHSLNGELDDFFVSLTGFSLGSYWHFVVDNDNYCDPSRPMAFAPTIL